MAHGCIWHCGGWMQGWVGHASAFASLQTQRGGFGHALGRVSGEMSQSWRHADNARHVRMSRAALAVNAARSRCCWIVGSILRLAWTTPLRQQVVAAHRSHHGLQPCRLVTFVHVHGHRGTLQVVVRARALQRGCRAVRRACGDVVPRNKNWRNRQCDAPPPRQIHARAQGIQPQARRRRTDGGRLRAPGARLELEVP